MALDVNGAAILSAIARTPSAFGMDEAEVNAFATTRLLARLKDKALTLDLLKRLMEAIGADDFKLALDHLGGTDVAALIKRFDPKNAALHDPDESWQRGRLVALAQGAAPIVAATRATRAAKPSPASPEAKAAGPKKSGAKTGAVMKSKALKARPKPSAT